MGFPLERFDAVGRAREPYDDGTAVDDTGELADKSTINGTEGLLAYLKTRDDQVMKTFSKKILGYALGRTVLASDGPLLRDMTTAAGNATFSDLAIKVVTSRQFLNHHGRNDVLPEPEMPSPAGISSANRPLPMRSGTR
jgi:hypothetical protein